MKKDNFDLRSFLVENRLTENSRGDEGRYHFDGSQNNSGRARVLNEMRIPADGANGSEAPYTGDEDFEDDPFGNMKEAFNDHHDPEYADSVPEGPYDSQRDVDFDQAVDECGDVPSDRTNDTLDECDLEEGNSNCPKAEAWLAKHPEIEVFHKLSDVIDLPDPDDPEYEDVETIATEAGYAFIQELESMLNSGKYDDEFIAGCCENGVIDDPEYGNGDYLYEAGYTNPDDEMEFGDEDDIAMMDLIRKDKGAAKAKKAAQKDLSTDAGNDPDPADLDAADDAPAIDPEDVDAAAGETDPNAETQYGLASQIQHTPTVEFEMDDEELDEYLSQFRRPQVAVNVLNRAIRGAQKEVNDSALDSLYIVLKNGFYETSRFQSGRVIATVHKEQGAADVEA